MSQTPFDKFMAEYCRLTQEHHAKLRSIRRMEIGMIVLLFIVFALVGIAPLIWGAQQ